MNRVKMWNLIKNWNDITIQIPDAGKIKIICKQLTADQIWQAEDAGLVLFGIEPHAADKIEVTFTFDSEKQNIEAL